MQFTLGKPKPWPVPPLIQASAGVHVAAAGLAVALPEAAAWALGGVVLNHAALTAAGLWPRSGWLGPNLTRLPDAAARRGQVAITIDDGPDPEVTPRVLDALAAQGIVATFFCIAERAAAHKALVREMLARGHAIENHSDVHRHHFSLLGPRGFEREIGRAQRTLADLCGRAPIAFRAPAGLRNPFLDPVLHRLGLHLVSWTRRGFDTREADPLRVLARLERGLAGGDILLMHDGHAARTRDGGVPVLLEVLPRLAARLREAGLTSVTLASAIAPRDAGGVAVNGDDVALQGPAAAAGAPAHAATDGTDKLDAAWRALHRAACAPYRRAGRFAWYFARGKLGRDPAFRTLIERGEFRPGVRVVDIGCGQGLLASLLREADRMDAAGQWPAAWPAAPTATTYTGLELMPRDVARAEAALAGDAGATRAVARFDCADMCTATLPPCDTVVILDVLHYVDHAAQRLVLLAVRAALAPGGSLLLRIGDVSQARRFAITRWVDRLVTQVRGHRVAPQWCRTRAEWCALLESLGFAVHSLPMSRGTPFANVLLIAQRSVAEPAVAAAEDGAR